MSCCIDDLEAGKIWPPRTPTSADILAEADRPVLRSQATWATWD